MFVDIIKIFVKSNIYYKDGKNCYKRCHKKHCFTSVPQDRRPPHLDIRRYKINRRGFQCTNSLYSMVNLATDLIQSHWTPVQQRPGETIFRFLTLRHQDLFPRDAFYVAIYPRHEPRRNSPLFVLTTACLFAIVCPLLADRLPVPASQSLEKILKPRSAMRPELPPWGISPWGFFR